MSSECVCGEINMRHCPVHSQLFAGHCPVKVTSVKYDPTKSALEALREAAAEDLGAV